MIYRTSLLVPTSCNNHASIKSIFLPMMGSDFSLCRQKTSRQGCGGRSKEDRLVGQRYHAQSLKEKYSTLYRVVSLDDYPVLQERPSQHCRLRRRHPKGAGASGKPLPCPQACPPNKQKNRKVTRTPERRGGERKAPAMPIGMPP